MIVDTSAIVAVLQEEPGHEALIEALHTELALRISAASYVEACAVMVRAPEKQALIDEFLRVFDVQIVPFDATQAKVAAVAYGQYGKGSGHPAKLNLGDTYSYALAKSLGEPLLFVGDDFVHTDVCVAVRAG